MRALITGGAGYIGSLLSSRLLAEGAEVVVVDKLLFGGDPVLPLFANPRFSFEEVDVTEGSLDREMRGVDVVFHLAALVGFPACQAAGETVAYRSNLGGTQRVFEAAEVAGVPRFILASTYSNYGVAADGTPVTEDAPLNPQSIYARTKIAAEQYLLERATASKCAVVIPRFTTLFGVSPRTRFDLMVNQFVLEALTERKLVLFQGNYRRSFVHVRDVVRALLVLASAPLPSVRGEIFNVGRDDSNHTKDEIVRMVCEAVPGVAIEHRDLSFGSDMRDVAVSCRKIADRCRFRAELTVEHGIREIRDAIMSGLIKEPSSERYRNHAPIVA